MTLVQACGLISLAQRWYWFFLLQIDWRHSFSQVMPFCYDGTNDMFEAQAWDMVQYTKDCQETWGVTPRLGACDFWMLRFWELNIRRPALANTLYGGRSLEAASNIVFTNGLLDPWSSGGVLKPVGGTAALIIPEGAHHLDLRAANPKDPVSVVDARKKERYVWEDLSFQIPPLVLQAVHWKVDKAVEDQ